MLHRYCRPLSLFQTIVSQVVAMLIARMHLFIVATDAI